MSFASKLKGLMEELDLTQAKVSDLTGIGRSSISQYVSGKNEPSKERRKEIARSLGVQDNYFEEYDPVATVQYNSTVNLPVELVAKLKHKERVAKNSERIDYAIKQFELNNIEFTLKNEQCGHFHCRRKSDDKLFQFWAGTGKILGYDRLRGIHSLIKLLLG